MGLVVAPLGAQSINTTYINSASHEIVRGTFNNGATFRNYSSGVLNFSNATFEAFCVEPTAVISNGQNVVYASTDLNSLTNAKAVGQIVSAFLSSTQTSVQAAGAQWAIWEVTSEKSAAFNLTSGTVRINSADAVDTQVLNAAKGFLATYQNFNATDLRYLTSGVTQNQVTWLNVSAVPEPSTALLFGLSGLTVLRRRR